MVISNRVLVVDDNKTINNFLVEHLKQYGFLPDFACTYETAVALLNRENYELIVLDSILNNGKTAIDLLSFIDSSTKIILLENKSSQSVNKIKNRSKRFDDFVPRAFKGRELAIKARALLNAYLPDKII